MVRPALAVACLALALAVVTFPGRTAPLRLANLLGFLIILFGIVVLLVVLGRYAIEGSSVPGFPFLASVMAIFSGVQLLSLGVIGEYIARIYTRTMERPAFVVAEEAKSP